MSDKQFLCEYCGYNSESRERCTHCGRDIADLFDNPAGFRIPLFGKMTLRLHDSAPAEQTWKELAEVWRKERVEKWPRKPSQLEKFDTSADTLELYCADYEADIMQSALGLRGSVDFQELSHEEMPHDPPYKLPRPPTVPRNKR